ncbi:MAG: DUF2892 domain-containing protein [Spirochaetia bacterium]|nr:DUF2892 domain-containing protein [Spirochaetia bacterium]
MSNLIDEIKKNMGSKERMIRISVGLILAGTGIFYFGGKNGEILGVVIALLGLLPLISGLFNYCPLYAARWFKDKKTSR